MKCLCLQIYHSRRHVNLKGETIPRLIVTQGSSLNRLPTDLLLNDRSTKMEPCALQLQKAWSRWHWNLIGIGLHPLFHKKIPWAESQTSFILPWSIWRRTSDQWNEVRRWSIGNQQGPDPSLWWHENMPFSAMVLLFNAKHLLHLWHNQSRLPALFPLPLAIRVCVIPVSSVSLQLAPALYQVQSR